MCIVCKYIPVDGPPTDTAHRRRVYHRLRSPVLAMVWGVSRLCRHTNANMLADINAIEIRAWLGARKDGGLVVYG